MAQALALVAPGRPLRLGLERILLAKRGALIVVGDGPDVLRVCSGGFLLDAEFSPQRISELAKLDGGVVLSTDAMRIARANVHLVPDPSIPTSETGTRHRTAERMARSIDVPVISVSAAMGVVTMYRNDSKHVLRPASQVHEQVGHALQTLQRFRQRFDLALAGLSALEVADAVTLKDIAAVLQPAELVTRIATTIEADLLELGDEGRILGLQLSELTDGVDSVINLVLRDYLKVTASGEAGGDGAHPRGSPEDHERALEGLARLTIEELADPALVGAALGIRTPSGDFDASVEPRGYRLLYKLPRFPDALVERVVANFSSLQEIMRASVRDLEAVDGVGATRARSLKDGLSRQAEATILDRYT
jgi:diadenylate cyclase